jgi:hypothetical protein
VVILEAEGEFDTYSSTLLLSSADPMMYLLLSILVFLVLVPKATPSFGIPGTTQTISGYDTELGEDPICWRSNASTVEGEIEDIPFPNPLVKNFKLLGEVALLRKCPGLNYITGKAPLEFQRGERLRTGKIYEYSVSITLEIASLGGNVFISDEGPLIGVQILLCKLGAGFCSPFIHEEANARLAAQGILTPPSKGDSHGGTHTHSGYNFFKVPPQDGPFYKLDVTVPMLVNTAGEYFAVASAQMYVGDELEEPATERYDMANAFLQDQRLITYQEPADILEVPDGVLIVSYVAIGVVAFVIFFLLVETIKNRNHQVLRLTQGCFLIVFLIAALVMVVSSFLFAPKNDHYCNASFPIVLISAQLLYAITIGRLWRINAVISPLLMHSLRQKTGWTSRMMEYLRTVTSWNTDSRRRRPKNLRKQISHWQLGLVVALFTLPQVIIQVLSFTLQPQWRTIDYNEDESKGRATCDSGFDMKSSLRDYGFWVFILLIVLLLFMAQATSELPSLFSETKVIYESALFSIVLLVLGMGIIIVTDDPATSPSVTYLVAVVWTLSIALNTSLRIMLPKLRMVWRNEKVVVSKLVSDHAKSVREEDLRFSSIGGTVSVLSSTYSHSSVRMSGMHSNSLELADAIVSECDNYQDHDKPGQNNEDTEKMNSSPGGSADFVQPPTPQFPPSETPKPGNDDGDSKPRANALSPRKKTPSSRILVQCDEPPSRRLLLKMVDLQQQLSEINSRVMSGLAVSEEEWNKVRTMSSKLGSTFKDDVDFAWDSDRADIPAQSKVQGGVVEEAEHAREHHSSVRFQDDDANEGTVKEDTKGDLEDLSKKVFHRLVGQSPRVGSMDHSSVVRFLDENTNGNEADTVEEPSQDLADAV